MSHESSDYEDALWNMQESYKDGIRAFAKWFAKEWQLSPEQWIKDYAEDPPSQEWFAGRNAGVQSVVDAVDCFIGEFHP